MSSPIIEHEQVLAPSCSMVVVRIGCVCQFVMVVFDFGRTLLIDFHEFEIHLVAAPFLGCSSCSCVDGSSSSSSSSRSCNSNK